MFPIKGFEADPSAVRMKRGRPASEEAPDKELGEKESLPPEKNLDRVSRNNPERQLTGRLKCSDRDSKPTRAPQAVKII